MALKSDRVELLTDISFFMNSVAERGGVVSAVGNGGAGAAMDDADAVVEYAADPSGALPIGILVNDVVNLDLTRQHINWHKDEVQLGGKVTVLRQGQVLTNLVDGTPAAGADAYVAASGYISTTQATGAAKIGQFLGATDSDGYAKVSVNL